MTRNSKFGNLSSVLKELHEKGEILLIPFKGGLDQVQVSATKNGFDSEYIKQLITEANFSLKERTTLKIRDFEEEDKLRSPLVAKLGLTYPRIREHGGNFGIKLGNYNNKNLIMLDIDSDENADLILDMIQEKWSTYTEVSKSGKYHLFYFLDEEKPRPKGWFKTQIDDGTRNGENIKNCIEIVSNGHTYIYPARYKNNKKAEQLQPPKHNIPIRTINNHTFIEIRDHLLTNPVFVKVAKPKKPKKEKIEACKPQKRGKLVLKDYVDQMPLLSDLLSDLVVNCKEGTSQETMRNVGNAIAIIGEEDFRLKLSELVDEKIQEKDNKRFHTKIGFITETCVTSHNTEMDYYQDHGLIRKLLEGVDKDFWKHLPRVENPRKQFKQDSVTSSEPKMLYYLKTTVKTLNEKNEEITVTTLRNEELHRNLSSRWGIPGYSTILLDLDTLDVFNGRIVKTTTTNKDEPTTKTIIYDENGKPYKKGKEPIIDRLRITPYIIDVAEKELGIRRFNKYLDQLWIKDGEIHKEFTIANLLQWIKTRFNMKDSSEVFVKGLIHGLNRIAEKDYTHVLFNNGILLNGDTLEVVNKQETENITNTNILWKTIDLPYLKEELDLTPNLDHPNPTIRAFTRIFIPKDDPTNTKKYYNALEKIGNMLRSNNYYKCIWIIEGEGDEGKSIFISILLNIFEKFIKTATPAQFDKDSRFSIVEFDGKILVVSETNKKQFAAIDALKRMSGNDSLSGEIKGVQGLFECQPPAMIIIATNHIPDFDTTETALMNRLDITKLKNQWKKPNDYDQNKNHYPVQTIEEQNKILTDKTGQTLLLNMGIQAAQQMGQDYTGRTTNEENKALIEGADQIYKWIKNNILPAPGKHTTTDTIYEYMNREGIPINKNSVHDKKKVTDAIVKALKFSSDYKIIRKRLHGTRAYVYPNILPKHEWLEVCKRTMQTNPIQYQYKTRIIGHNRPTGTPKTVKNIKKS